MEAGWQNILSLSIAFEGLKINQPSKYFIKTNSQLAAKIKMLVLILQIAYYNEKQEEELNYRLRVSRYVNIPLLFDSPLVSFPFCLKQDQIKILLQNKVINYFVQHRAGEDLPPHTLLFSGMSAPVVNATCLRSPCQFTVFGFSTFLFRVNLSDCSSAVIFLAYLDQCFYLLLETF